MKAKRRAKATVKQRVQLLAAVIALGAVFAGVGVASSPSWFTGSNVAPAEAVEQPVAAAPVAATVVWQEGFETGTGNAPSQLGSYRSSSYSADPFWLNYADCNGVVVNYVATYPSNNTYCVLPNDRTTQARDSRFKVSRMADVLGQVAAGAVGGSTDTTPVNASSATTRTNHAVTAMTSTAASSSVDLTVFESQSAIGLSQAGYYVASIDVAEDSCSARPGGANNNSRLDYALLIGAASTARALTASPIIACNVVGGRYTSPIFSTDNASDP